MGLVVALLLISVVGLAAGLVVVSQARQTADNQRALLRKRLYPADVSRVYRLWQQGQIEGLAEILDRYLPQPGEEDLRGFEWYFLRQQVQRSQIQPRLTYRGHSGNVYCAYLLPDGKTVASAGADSVIQLWDAKTGDLRTSLLGHTNEVNWLHPSPDGRLLASTSDDETIRLWDLSSHTQISVLRAHKGEVGTAIFSPDGQTIVSGGEDGMIRLWDVATRSLRREWKAHETRINAVLFSADGRTLASVATGSKTKVWDAASATLRYALDHPGAGYSLALSPDGRLMATADGIGRMQLWELETGRLLRVLDSQGVGVHCCSFSPDGERLVSSDEKGMIRILSLKTGMLLTQFRAHSKQTECALLAPDGQSIITASRDSTVKIWQPTFIPSCQPLGPYTENVQHLIFSPTLSTLAVRSKEAVELWDLSTPEARRSLTISVKNCQFCFSPDGQTLAVLDDRGSIRLVDAAHGDVRFKRDTRNPSVAPQALAFTQDGQRLALFCSDGTLWFWDPANGKEELCGQRGRDLRHPQFLAVIPDSKTLATIHYRYVNLWKDEQETWLASESLLQRTLLTAAASPDGRLLALGGSHQSLQLLDTSTGERYGEFFGHQGDVRSVAFSPDGRTLASASADGTVRLWHVATQQELFILENRGKPMLSVAFSADGKTLATAGDPAQGGHSVFLWRIAEE
jgi:WD40 repeat protein